MEISYTEHLKHCMSIMVGAWKKHFVYGEYWYQRFASVWVSWVHNIWPIAKDVTNKNFYQSTVVVWPVGNGQVNKCPLKSDSSLHCRMLNLRFIYQIVEHSSIWCPLSVAYPGILFGGGVQNSVEDKG